MIGGEDKEFKSKPNASVLQVVTAQSDQQYEARDDANDVSAELRTTPNRSPENSGSRALYRLRKTVADPEPGTSGETSYRDDSDNDDDTPRKRVKHDLSTILDDLPSTRTYSSNRLRWRRIYATQKKKRVTSVVHDEDDEESQELQTPKKKAKQDKKKKNQQIKFIN